MKQILVFMEPENREAWLKSARLGFTQMQLHKETGIIERARSEGYVFKFASCPNKQAFAPRTFRQILDVEGITHIWAFDDYSYGPFIYRYFPDVNYAEFRSANVLNILSSQIIESEGGHVHEII